MVAVLQLVVDGKVLDPRDAFTNIDKFSKDVVAKVLDPKDALKTNGSFFPDVDVTVCYPPGMPLINIGTLHLAIGA